MKKRQWLITLCALVLLVTVLIIIKIASTNEEHLTDNDSAVSDIVDEEADDIAWADEADMSLVDEDNEADIQEDEANISPVVEDYEVELQEDDVIEFR